uniref:Glycine receptor subunit beta-type 4 (inferred by orthology to a C. elegans protein) n=1 Tax=Strongyloides venezuelensis TaxID=75913 RepID=A0A0K0FA10_STRVS
MRKKVVLNWLFYLLPLVSSKTNLNQNYHQKHNELIEVINILKDTENYNKNLYPNEEKEIPTKVLIQMYIEGMSSFRAQSMDFLVDIYFQTQWIDERLKHNGKKRILIRDKKTFDLMWQPGLYFANSRESAFHEVSSPNFLVWIYPNGTVFYDTRISLNVICMQDLSKYPLDSQACTLRILSYPYDNNQVTIEWNKEKAIDVNEDLRMTDMTLRTIRPGTTINNYVTGLWACATAEFIVDREIMHHVLQTYLPTSLIVIISWFSFWLDAESVPARVSLSITCLLTLATQNSAARMALPQASYVKAIDVWMGGCTSFVFLAIIEFTVVNFCNRKINRKRRKFSCCSERCFKPPDNQFSFQTNINNQEKDEKLIPYNISPMFGKFIKRNDERTNRSLKKYSLYNEAENLGSINESYDFNYPIHRNSVLRCCKLESPFISFSSLPKSNILFHQNSQCGINRRNKRSRSNSTNHSHSFYSHYNRESAQKIDHKSRVYFPITFIIFNILYWFYYLYYSVDNLY